MYANKFINLLIEKMKGGEWFNKYYVILLLWFGSIN